MDLAGLAAFWELEEASGTRNDSHSTNHLTDNNTVTQQTGKVGSCAQFTKANSEYLSIADNAALSMGSGVQFTLHCWLYSDGSLEGNGILGKWGGTANEYALLYVSSRFYLSIRNAANTASVNREATSFGAASAATWYFLMAQYNGTHLKISVNDGTVDSTAHTGDVANSNAAFLIGAYYLGDYWSGRIDQVGVWKRALTAGEITTLYNGGAGLSYAAMQPAAGIFNNSRFARQAVNRSYSY